ncbi:hypothetical protein [Devosia sp. FKR38]|uniref:hypothetical protein n=1 Tax=Devosia sp. FKR38 TaxID=2562312 RepID=UPI0010BF9F15|nr:hypothetical protein [Devosia sp. FKR38]
MKQLLKKLWMIESQIRGHIRISRFFWFRVPLVGRAISMILDRLILIAYGVDMLSSSIDIRRLSISHPNGILLGGNGVVSSGRVAIMAGVSLVARSPSDPTYLERHSSRTVFRFGDNVVIGAGSVVVGPIDICDNVIIGAMSLVNKSISEPGIYVGVPVRRVKDQASDEWVQSSDAKEH